MAKRVYYRHTCGVNRLQNGQRSLLTPCVLNGGERTQWIPRRLLQLRQNFQPVGLRSKDGCVFNEVNRPQRCGM